MHIVHVHSCGENVVADWQCQGCGRVVYRKKTWSQVNRAIKAGTYVEETACPACTNALAVTNKSKRGLLALARESRKRRTRLDRVLCSEVYLANQLLHYLQGLGQIDSRLPKAVKTAIMKHKQLISPDEPRTFAPLTFHIAVLRGNV